VKANTTTILQGRRVAKRLQCRTSAVPDLSRTDYQLPNTWDKQYMAYTHMNFSRNITMLRLPRNNRARSPQLYLRKTLRALQLCKESVLIQTPEIVHLMSVKREGSKVSCER
jgi:hypothetical protein